MNRFVMHAIAVAVSLVFSAGATAQNLSNAEYKSAKDSIAADYKSAKAACASFSGNAKDICMAEAKGGEKVAKAELDARNKPTDKARHAVSVAKAQAAYSVAKEQCDDKAGNDKKVCVKQAKAAETRAKADAKAQMTTADANKTAASTPPKAPAASTSKKASAGQYVDDSVITAKVKAAVLEEPSLKSAEINVETHKGKVQLSGFVRSRADINRAVQVVRRVEGVQSVDNVMIVKGQQ